MRTFVLRLVTYGIAIALVAYLLPGIHLINNDFMTLLIVALIFGIVNAFIRPIVMVLGCPFIFLSLGILLPIINGLMFMLAAWLAQDRLTIDDPSLVWAIIAGLIMMVIVIVLERVFRIDDESRRYDRKRREREQRIHDITGRLG